MHFPFKTELELIKKYRFKSIFWVYFKYIFIVTFIPVMIISSAIVAYYFFSSRVEFNNSAYQKTRIFAVSTENALKEIDNAHFKLSANEDIRSYALNAYSYDKLKTDLTVGEIYDDLLEIQLYSRYVENIHIYFPTQNYIISNTETNQAEKHSQSVLFDSFTDNQIKKYIINDLKSGILHYAHPINIAPDILIICVYDVKMNDIFMSPVSDSDIYIAESPTNNVIYSNTGKTDIKDKDILQAMTETEEISSYANCVVINIPVYDGQYNFITRTHRTIPTGITPTLFLALISIIILTILIPILVAFYFSSRFYSSISELTSAFGGYNLSLDDNANELVFLSNNITTALERNKLIENQLASNVQNLNLLQTQALQMQINPHFVFNTLNLANVIVMRELKKRNDAEIVISHLANLMSFALDSKKTVISISEELKYIEEFIEIEKIRFKNKFDVVYDIKPAVYDRNIIKFTLQPILENAFEYGIKPLKNERGIIKIKAWHRGQDTLVTISNNGETISQEKLNELRKTLDSPDAPEKHIGLYNVNKRIKLMCGEKYGVHITSGQGITSVTTRFKL